MSHRNERDYFAYFESFLIHAVLCLILFLAFHQKDDGGGKPETIQFETVNEKKSARRHQETVAKGNTSRTQAVSTHHVSLSDLGLRLNTEPLPATTEENFHETSAPVADEGGWDVMNPDPRIARFNQYIYNTVQGWLDRDAFLNTQRVYGTVKVKLWFDENGEWIEKDTVYDAVDENFQKIVMRALRKSFANPIPRPFLFKREKFSIERMVVIREGSF